MRSRNLKIVLKEDAKEIFNPMEEKNKFLKRLYKENITPPKKTLCKSLFPVFQKDNIDNIVNYGLLIALLIVSGGEIKIEYDTSSIKLNSPVIFQEIIKMMIILFLKSVLKQMEKLRIL